MALTITELCTSAHDNALKHGFYDQNEKINIGEKLMLIVSELGEALEADRKGKHVNPVWGSITDDIFERHIKDSFEDELADAVIRIGDLAGALNIDLESHIIRKMEYNSHRPYKHGKAY